MGSGLGLQKSCVLFKVIVIIINIITQTWSPTPKLDVKLPYKGGSSLNSSTSAARLVPKKMILLSGPSIDRMWIVEMLFVTMLGY